VNKPRTIAAVQPNAGIRAAYRKKLLRLVDEMIVSYEHWLLASYRRNPPAMAQDATPSKELERALKQLARRWEKNFTEMAWKMGGWFAQSIEKRSRAALMTMMKKAGWTVRFTMTPQMRDVSSAIVTENVGLIKSIPQQFHTQIEGMVMRSVARGRDLGTLRKDLQKTFHTTRKRAELIARDQNNKATNQLARVRQLEMGITQAVWMHSAAGKTPRPTHVANNGKVFDLSTGWYDPAEKKHILPGELINCRCVSRPIVKGFP
jgi:SPP1 gp7 family putative phage head morphogenesis protein